MKSSSGAHFVALDHVRALAAFLVFAWHFTHAADGFPVPFDYTPLVFPLALLDEGHTGVALFMTLSGYLFAKLLDGSHIHYPAFLWNRALRLLPLLLVVVTVVGLMKAWRGENLADYLDAVLMGALYPSLPNGAWSITVEMHYYLVLPLFLWLLRRSRYLPLVVVAAALALRTGLYLQRGEVQIPAYWTLVGRIDQFAFGMMLFHFRAWFGRHLWVSVGAVLAFMAFYAWFDAVGGFYRYPAYPSSNPLWIVLPTLEGLGYGIAIACYDARLRASGSWLSRVVARYGDYSYAIYLLHVFVVFHMARFVHEHVMDLSNFYVACLWALVGFALMGIPGYFSMRFIEMPFLRMRRRYVRA